MIHTILGAENFRKGMDLYFQRHDGQAVTCEDFVSAMSDASSVDLSQFQRWYAQAGTPVLKVEESWDEKLGMYALDISQKTDATPGQETKESFHIPILVGLLDDQGDDLAGVAGSHYEKRDHSFLLELKEEKQTFVFNGLKKRPKLSLLRQLSAPVRVEGFHSREDLAFLMGHDTDLFNRWDAAFSLSESIIIEVAALLGSGRQPLLDQTFIEAVRKNVKEDHTDKSLAAMALTLPTEAYMAQVMQPVDPESLHLGYMFVVRSLSEILENDFYQLYEENSNSREYSLSPEEMGKRSLKNICLFYLLSNEQPSESARALCVEQFKGGTNMTDKIAALTAVSHLQIPERDEMLDNFERTWIDEPLVMDKWFTIQASSRADDTFARVQKLMSHPVFSITNPNKIRSLIGAFSANHHRFHSEDGSGYTFLTDMILEIDRKNHQIAARLVNPLISYKRYEPVRKRLMKEQLERIIRQNISRDVYEIVHKSLC
jgi:aminopeptidase N